MELFFHAGPGERKPEREIKDAGRVQEVSLSLKLQKQRGMIGMMTMFIALMILTMAMSMRVYAEENASSGVYASQSLGNVLFFNTNTNPHFSTVQETYAAQAVEETKQQAAQTYQTTMIGGRQAIPLGRFKLTGYCPCYRCSEGYGTRTASGARATAGRTVAVDPRVIPYGTHLLINGHEYIAEDCGGGVRGNHIDVFYNTHGEARNILAYAEVYILS